MNEDDILGLPKEDTGHKVTIADYLKDSYGTPARPIWDMGDSSTGIAVEAPLELKDILEKARIFEDAAEDAGRAISAPHFEIPKIKRVEVRSKVTFVEHARLAGPELNWELARERVAEMMLKDLVKALDESGLTNFTEITGPDDIMYILSINVVANE